MKSRIELAEAILKEYCRLKGEPLDSFETGITDLITDLMHLANKEDLDGIVISGMAMLHFEAEKLGLHN
jgi:NTP pyrophosphatase (non-canonical NTP hydrolase)